MRSRWRVDENSALLLCFVWLVVGLFVVVGVAVATPRHSLAIRIAVLVWTAPMLVAVICVLWSVMRLEIGDTPRLGFPFRRVREPVTKDLRDL